MSPPGKGVCLLAASMCPDAKGVSPRRKGMSFSAAGMCPGSKSMSPRRKTMSFFSGGTWSFEKGHGFSSKTHVFDPFPRSASSDGPDLVKKLHLGRSAGCPRRAAGMASGGLRYRAVRTPRPTDSSTLHRNFRNVSSIVKPDTDNVVGDLVWEREIKRLDLVIPAPVRVKLQQIKDESWIGSLGRKVLFPVTGI